MRLRALCILLLVLFGATIVAARVEASTILFYEGALYTSVTNHPLMDGEYTTSMKMTGFVELVDPLAPNCVCSFSPLGDYEGLLDFSFFDGIQPHRGGDNADSFSFTTDALGNIVGWDVYLSFSLGPNAPVGGSDIEVFISSVGGDHGYELCDNCDEEPQPFHGFESTTPGHWTVVPEPPTLLLLGAGFALIAAARRQQE